MLIGSSAGDIGTKGYGVYGATTTDVRSFTRTWANGFAPKGIRVNVVSCGPNDTALMAGMSFSGMIPLGRMGRPDDAAHAVLPGAWIKRVAQTVAEQVERQYGHEDCHARP